MATYDVSTAVKHIQTNIGQHLMSYTKTTQFFRATANELWGVFAYDKTTQSNTQNNTQSVDPNRPPPWSGA